MPSVDPYLPPQRRPTALVLTVLMHMALAIAWQAARHAPPVDTERAQAVTQWISLPAPARMPAAADEPVAAPAPPATATAMRRQATPALRPPRPQQAPSPAAAAGAPNAITLPAPAAPATAASTAQDDRPGSAQAAAGSAASAPAGAGAAARILERARRDAGAIDRTLRKENYPYIVAPPDSPQIRMRKGMEGAADMAAPGLFEAPRVAELVNNTGNGDRRSKVVTGNGTYCITERAPTTRIDMIEKHGKQTLTSCPAHETPAAAQQWRTARD
ncbi:hypothetical protein HH212_15840 [Massilia forsythiae]|uniref:Uncharacterized protein n=1 Tax=Massilia forsythiae TaxID=2728020 RepID=A0A7Z2VXL6_9BURK|nr:hypothetical protein [Massilia forsythiae]QJE01321.1 hypothetical protein HH212_15840 [Massilia forsythiae]